MDLDGNPANPDTGVSATADAVVLAIQKRQREQAATLKGCIDEWTAFANRHGLSLSDDERTGTRRTEGVIDEMRVAVEVVLDDDGWAHTLVTTSSVRSRVPTDAAYSTIVALYPSPKGIFNIVRAALFGKEDIRVGDEAFDKRFLIHSEPKEAAPTMLDAPTRKLIGEWCGNPLEAIQFDHGTVYVQSSGVEVGGTALDRALAIAMRLAAWQSGSAYR